MHKKTLQFHFTFTVIVSLFVFSCNSKDDPSPKNPQAPNDSEVITSLQLFFEDSLTGSKDTLYFRDGVLSNKPAIYDTVAGLVPNRTYFVRLEVLNESISPIDTITKEIKLEGASHQFFFSGNLVPNSVDIQYTDKDENNLPIGITTKWTTKTALQSGRINVVLKHELNKTLTANGIYNSAAGGETDIDLNFFIQ